MNDVKPKEMFFDFLNTVFLLALIAFLVFYFIAKNNWGMAEKIAKNAMNLSVLGVLLLIKLKTIRIKFKNRKEEESFDDIVVYFDRFDKIKSFLAILAILILMSLGSFFWGVDLKTSLTQIIIVFLVSYLWHIFLFRKRGSVAIRLYAIILDEIIDSILIYFSPVLVLSVSWLFSCYSSIDMFNALAVLGILYIRHKILFVLNDKK